MIFETYTLTRADKLIEFGFRFKEPAHTYSSLFDAVLGVVAPSADLCTVLKEAWAANAPYAWAMCADTLTEEQRETLRERLGVLESRLNGDETNDDDRADTLDEIAAIEAKLEA